MDNHTTYHMVKTGFGRTPMSPKWVKKLSGKTSIIFYAEAMRGVHVAVAIGEYADEPLRRCAHACAHAIVLACARPPRARLGIAALTWLVFWNSGPGFDAHPGGARGDPAMGGAAPRGPPAAAPRGVKAERWRGR